MSRNCRRKSGGLLDWDSPSDLTGTVKRRPISGSFDTAPNNVKKTKIPGLVLKSGVKKSSWSQLSRDKNVDVIVVSSEKNDSDTSSDVLFNNGKLSDSDSGIASPLSPPSSLKGFFARELEHVHQGFHHHQKGGGGLHQHVQVFRAVIFVLCNIQGGLVKFRLLDFFCRFMGVLV